MNILKIVSLLLIVFTISCKKDTVDIVNQKLTKDTLILKEHIEADTVFNVFKRKTNYKVSINGSKSDVSYTLLERYSGETGVSKSGNKNNFNELRLILKEASSEYKLDSLSYMVYGVLYNKENEVYCKNIADKYIGLKGNHTNIPTKDYGVIMQLILESDFIKELNKTLAIYSKSVNKVLIEKAHFRINKNTNEKIIDCMVVLKLN